MDWRMPGIRTTVHLFRLTPSRNDLFSTEALAIELIFFECSFHQWRAGMRIISIVGRKKGSGLWVYHKSGRSQYQFFDSFNRNPRFGPSAGYLIVLAAIECIDKGVILVVIVKRSILGYLPQVKDIVNCCSIQFMPFKIGFEQAVQLWRVLLWIKTLSIFLERQNGMDGFLSFSVDINCFIHY